MLVMAIKIWIMIEIAIDMEIEMRIGIGQNVRTTYGMGIRFTLEIWMSIRKEMKTRIWMRNSV